MTSIIKYNGKNLLYFNFEVKIFPGINEVENAVLDGILSHKSFAARFKKGDLVLVEDNREEKGKKRKEKSENEVVALIEDTFDVGLLNKFIKKDGRASVVQAAKARIDFLSYKSEEKEPDIGKHGHFE